MATSFAYDHPAYLVRGHRSTHITAGAATVGRFQAHADLIARAAFAIPVVAGTSAGETVIVYKVATTGGATTALATITMGGSASITGARAAISATAIANGDEVRFLSGTDATVQYNAGLEFNVTPGADVL